MNQMSNPIDTALQAYVDKANWQAEQAERERQAYLDNLAAQFDSDLAEWLPADLITALAVGEMVRQDKRRPITFYRPASYKGKPGGVYYYDTGDKTRGSILKLEFSDSSNYHLQADIKQTWGSGPLPTSANKSARTVTPAGAAELGELFYRLEILMMGEAATARAREADRFFYDRAWTFATESQMRAFYANEYVPLYGEDPDKVKGMDGHVAQSKRNAEYEAERQRERAEQDAAQAEYQARQAKAQAEADSIWHPFTVYRVEYGAIVSDGDGSAGPALDNVYTLTDGPYDPEGYWRRINAGKVTRVLIPHPVLIEEIKVETMDQAARLPVCKTWSKAGTRFYLPPNTVLIGDGAPAEDEDDTDPIPF